MKNRSVRTKWFRSSSVTANRVCSVENLEVRAMMNADVSALTIGSNEVDSGLVGYWQFENNSMPELTLSIWFQPDQVDANRQSLLYDPADDSTSRIEPEFDQ
ncbi:MAG: hypothetical protein R3C28_26440 [Pirellulaceae bacterium]